MSGLYPEKQRLHDVRDVSTAIENGTLGRDPDAQEAARRLGRLSAISILEIVLRVQRCGITLVRKPERESAQVPESAWSKP